MLGVTGLRTYLIGTIAIVLLPGPNSMYVLSTAATYGVRRGYRAATGVFLGDAVLMVASPAGVASLSGTSACAWSTPPYAAGAVRARWPKRSPPPRGCRN